jgi:hypothetical protein
MATAGPLRGPFLDDDFHSVRHHHARSQHLSHHGQQPLIGHPPGNPIEQPLMMNPIEKLRQIQIDQRLIAGLQMLRCLSDRGVSAPTRTEAMAAVMESRLEDRLQNLEHGLLSRPVHYICKSRDSI